MNIRIERIHDLWIKASRAARAAIRDFSEAVEGTATPTERRRLARRAAHLHKRAHTLAMAEVRAVFGNKQGA